MACGYPIGRIGRDYSTTISMKDVNGTGPIRLDGDIEVNFFSSDDELSPAFVASLANGKISSIDVDNGIIELNVLASDTSLISQGFGAVEIVRASSGNDTIGSYLAQWILPSESGPPSGMPVNCYSGNVIISVRYDYDAAAGMVADHVSEADPHAQYLKEVDAAAIYARADLTAEALATKASLNSPNLIGTPTAPTAAPGTNTTQLATTAFVKKAVDDLVAAAPGALDTLDELSAALGDDANFAATMTNALAAKAPLASPALFGVPTAPTAAPDTNTTQLATTAFAKKEADDAEAAAKAHSVQRANHTGEQAISTITGLQAALDGKETAGTAAGWIAAHVATADPHAQYALESEVATTYATTAALSAHSARTDNPHAVTKAQVGLGNVDNTSDSDKPVSTATATAIAAKQDTLVSGTNIKTINGSSILGPGNLAIGGAGGGDMSAAVYDTDSDGIVDAAETAPWSGISGKPSTYPPDAHGHTKSSIIDFAEVTENAKTSAYTLVIGDAGKMVTMASATAVTLTVPTNASVSYPIGTRIDILSLGAGDVSVAGDTGVTVQSLGAKLKLAGQYAGATLWKQAANVWVLIGALKS